MKKTNFFLTLITATFLAVSCSKNTNTDPGDPSDPGDPGSPTEPSDPGTTDPTLESITVVHTVNEYTVGDSVDKSTLTVTAHYDDESSAVVSASDYTVTFDSSEAGTNVPVKVTYLGKEFTYTVIVNAPIPVNHFPNAEVEAFLLDRGTSFDTSSIEIFDDIISSYEEVEDEPPYFLINFTESCDSDISDMLGGLGFTVENGYSVDPAQNVAVAIYAGTYTSIRIYAYNDVQEIEAPEEDFEHISFDLCRDTIKTENDITGQDWTVNDKLIFNFYQGTGIKEPASDKTSTKGVLIYGGNQMKITAPDYYLRKIEITFVNVGASMDSDSGTVSFNGSTMTWTGNTDEVTFTNTGASKYSFFVVDVYYLEKDGKQGSLEGVSTISEVITAANNINFVTNSKGWAISEVAVTVQVEAIDCIDSGTFAGGLDANAEGKTLCIDNTGYIICSSATAKYSLYQTTKYNFQHSKSTIYEISGHIAKFNGVYEIKVDSFFNVSDVSITATAGDFVAETFTTQSSYLEDVYGIQYNDKGYGVGKIVRYQGLTYFNKYNSAGSYLFLDQDGKVIPVYSLNDRAKNYINENKAYNIVGLESIYNGRPSLRILSISENTVLDPVTDVYQWAVSEINDLSMFYDVKFNPSSFDPVYFTSEMMIVEADVYISRYANEDKYTINTNYFVNSNKDYDKYTTGNTQSDAANKRSLGVFNENLSYNGTFAGWVLEEANSVEDVLARKVHVYFTLTWADNVDGLNMWRVNILEDYVEPFGA